MKICDQPVSQSAAFGQTTSGTPLFNVQADIPLCEILEQIAFNLGNAAFLCTETIDADLQTGRSLNQIIAQLVETSRGLVAAGLEGVNRPGHCAEAVAYP